MKPQKMTEQDLIELEQAAKSYFDKLTQIESYVAGTQANAERYARVILENQRVLRG